MQIGVAEVWRYTGETVTIFQLAKEEYLLQTTSTVLPGLTSEVISRFLVDGQTTKRTEWIRRVREWARRHTKG